MTAWSPYQPSSQNPWNAERVVHLHRRAVFGCTLSELRRDLESQPQECVDRVLAGKCRQQGVPDEFDQLSEVIGQAAIAQLNVDRLKAWWIYRFLFTPDPLRERLALMWHNHFATSNLKVNSLPLMFRQNETFRSHGHEPFGDLLHAVLRDPAMLIWLDAPTNRRGHANENLARELMELFTLGIGNYTEDDVKNAARALTGITVRREEYALDPIRHDDGQKRILDETDNFDSELLCELLLRQTATPLHLANRLISEFFGEGVVQDPDRHALAVLILRSNLDIGKAVEIVLRSELFFSDANISSRVSDPVSFVIAPIRALQLHEKPPSTLELSAWLKRMGMDLFYPPNVAGWPGGRHWLTTRTVIARANFATALVSGALHHPIRPPELKLPMEQAPDLALTDALATLLTGKSGESTDKYHSTESIADTALELLTGPLALLH